MAISTDQIKQLRKETKAGLMDIRKALEESNGNMGKAKKWLAEKGLSKALKKADRETSEGVVASYIHTGGTIGSLVKLGCETDFVAKTEEFRKLAYEIGMQIASMNPKDVEELLEQEYIRDPKKKVKDLIGENIAKLGENIKVIEFCRMEI